MKKLISTALAGFVLATSLTAAPDVGAADGQLRLSDESNLTLLRGNTYVTGVCGTVTADTLAANFEGKVTLTSPAGDILTGDTLVPSDTEVSTGTESMKILIYGDTDRNGRLSLSDVSAMLKHIAGWNNDICEDAFDLNWDRKNNLTDVAQLLKKIAGWNVPVGTDIEPMQITLSYYDSDCTEIGVIWHSVQKAMTPAVQVAEGETSDFTDARMIYGDTNSGIGDANSRAIIDGLEPGKTYSYRVGDASGYWSEPASFTVREGDPDGFTFLCFTDTQSKNSNPGNSFKTAWAAGLASYPEAELALHCGDIVESVGSGDWSKMLDPSAEYLRRIPMMAVSGNHETSYAGSMGIKMQYNHFNTDMPEQTSVDGGYFYSFDYDNVHFIMLNTNKQGTADDSLSDEQMAWLKADLESSDAEWTVVLMHHPIYSTGHGDTDRWSDPMVLAMRPQLAPLFAEHGVDVVLAGHDHVYYCTYPIDGEGNALSDTPAETVDGTVYYTDPAGVVYATPGCTGDSSRGSNSGVDKSYYRNVADGKARTFYAVTVEDGRITFDYCCASGGEAVVYDSWGIVK